MNNKIEELKKQCTVDKYWDGEKELWVHKHVDLDKFAQSIINECAGAIVKEVNNWQQLAPFNNIIKQRGVHAIKQHFGL
jgi:hypothetical protein